MILFFQYCLKFVRFFLFFVTSSNCVPDELLVSVQLLHSLLPQLVHILQKNGQTVYRVTMVVTGRSVFVL